MSWLSNFVRPKIRALVKKSDTPNNLWVKCNNCGTMVYHKDLKETSNVCPTCNHHMKMSARQRINWVLDEGTITDVIIPQTISDPLNFKDNKKYIDRLKVSKRKTQNEDAIIIARGKIGSNNAIVAALDFGFMGGSMGVAVGEGLLEAAKEAINHNFPLVVFTSSGGARMQEGIFSLMQLPRTVIAVNKLKENNIPYIVILTDPTTGGVSASFAMLGDVTYAEPGALIGFAGPRVIQSTVNETLPEGFQTSEYLLEHGMIDDVVSRKNLKAVIANTIMHLVNNVTKQKLSSH
ncbi:acetyl-CoA carboxylase, carboxyltransferase subunit beta [Alphaproteobacteria bacterium]|nr:acetyl-CoA carboxylase, carboxyltransferase subunit beta [Alphaproteobacteria bacterium]